MTTTSPSTSKRLDGFRRESGGRNSGSGSSRDISQVEGEGKAEDEGMGETQSVVEMSAKQILGSEIRWLLCCRGLVNDEAGS